MWHKLLIVLYVVATCRMHAVSSNHDEDTWVEPNAWGLEQPDEWRVSNIKAGEDLASCPVCDKPAAFTEAQIELTYYKRFIGHLFNRKKLQYNEAEELYQRALIFNVLPGQLEKLENLHDPRDLDSVLTEIIATTRTIAVNGADGYSGDSNSSIGFVALILDIVKDFVELLKISEFRFAMIVVSTVLVCWFLHHRYHIGIVRMVLISFFLFGYFMTYLQCNRKLEVDELIEYIAVEEKEPAVVPSWYSPMVNMFKSKKDDRVEKLRKTTEIKLRYCRPDHVLLMYFNEMFMKQLEFLIEKFSSTMQTFSTNMPWPYSMLAPVLLIAMLTYVLKLTYKYVISPRAWAPLLRSCSPQAAAHQPQHPQLTNATNDDRISGENLKMLLNAIRAPNVLVTNGLPIGHAAVSGVQDVLEQIEAPPSTVSSKNNSPNTSKHINNNNALDNEESVEYVMNKSQVTLEDCGDNGFD